MEPVLILAHYSYADCQSIKSRYPEERKDVKVYSMVTLQHSCNDFTDLYRVSIGKYGN